jgi:hypothetical protein
MSPDNKPASRDRLRPYRPHRRADREVKGRLAGDRPVAGAADVTTKEVYVTMPAAAREVRHAIGACRNSDLSAHYVTMLAPRPNSLHLGERSGTCAVLWWHYSLRDTALSCSG